MDNACQDITTRPSPPRLDALSQTDLEMIARVRDVLVTRAIKPPSWRDVDPEKRRKFFDEVRGVLIEQGGDRSNINRRAQPESFSSCAISSPENADLAIARSSDTGFMT